MKAYKRDLSHFFSVKKEEELRLQKTLAKKTFEEKKKIIEDYRASAVLNQGTFTMDDHEFKREHFIRDIHYLEQLKEELEEKYLQFNKYKYDVLYELTEMNESVYDRLSAEIEEIKQKRDELIHKKAIKQEPIHEYIEKRKNDILKLKDKFNNPNTVLVDKKVIYSNIMKHKIAMFNLMKPRLNMVRNDEMNTLVIDYLPIRGNQRNMMKLNESVNITPIVLEDIEEMNPDEDNESRENNSRNKTSVSVHSTPSYEYAYENGSVASGSNQSANRSQASGSNQSANRSQASGSNQSANGSVASGSNQSANGSVASGSNQSANRSQASGSNQSANRSQASGSNQSANRSQASGSNQSENGSVESGSNK